MPDAERVVRRFPADADIEVLYAFVECYDILSSPSESEEYVNEPKDFKHEYKFQLVSPMPREVFEIQTGGTIGQRIGRSGNLIVERTDLEDGDDGEEEDE
jgi:FAS-associated factor 2